MKYWLIKSEPEVFSIADLAQKKRTYWDGVRNYAARNHMQAMAVGDQILFYHSMADPAGVAGVAKVVKTAYPDHTAFDPKDDHFDPKSKTEKPTWFMVDIGFVKKFDKLLTAAELKQHAELKNMVLFRIGRFDVPFFLHEIFSFRSYIFCGALTPKRLRPLARSIRVASIKLRRWDDKAGLLRSITRWQS